MVMVMCCVKPLPSLFVVIASLASTPPTMALRNIKVGDAIPAFSIQALDGTRTSNETYKGRPLLLVFARPEHEKSLKALRVANRILKGRTETKLAVLAVSTKPGSDEYFKRIATELTLTYPVAMDPDRRMYGAFGLVVAPTTLLIDETGVLRFELAHMPPSYDRQLRLHTDLLLGRLTREEHDKRLTISDETTVKGQDAWTRRLGLAEALLEQKKLGQALPILIELYAEKDAVALGTLIGTTLIELKRVDEAAKYLEPLAGRQPDSPKVKYALALLEVARSNDKAAERYLIESLAVSPDKGPIHYQLGRVYERRGDLAKAVQHYRKALEGVYDREGR